MIVIGDPQITNAYSPYYTSPDDNPIKKSDVERFTTQTMADIKQTIKSLPAGTPVYGLSMGDDVQYFWWLQRQAGATDTPGIGGLQDASFLCYRQSRPGRQGTLPQEMGGEFRSYRFFLRPWRCALCLHQQLLLPSRHVLSILLENCVSAR